MALRCRSKPGAVRSQNEVDCAKIVCLQMLDQRVPKLSISRRSPKSLGPKWASEAFLKIDRVHFPDPPEFPYLPTGPHLLQALGDLSVAQTGPPIESSAWPDGPTTEPLEGPERGEARLQHIKRDYSKDLCGKSISSLQSSCRCEAAAQPNVARRFSRRTAC